MVRIWLVRHGQSGGQTRQESGVDPELTELGKRQAERLAEPLSAIPVDRILISPLKRVWQTFELSRAAAPQMAFDSRLIEHGDGVPSPYEAILPVVTPDIAEPDTQDAWREHSSDRARDLMAELLGLTETGVMLFGHCGLFSILCRVFMDIDPGHKPVGAQMDNAGISLLALKDDGRRIIEIWNDRSHVIDLLQDPYGFHL